MWNFSKLFTNTQTLENLKSNALSGRISHSQLFFGREGSEALPTALAYAKYIFCNDKTPSDACNLCQSCKQIDGLNHPDLKIYFPFPYTKGKIESSSDLINEFKSEFIKNPYLNLFKFSQSISAEKKSFAIPTSECESLNKFLSLKSFYGGKKIAIIWYPELINTSGANKLLKTIEEPAGDTLILFVSHNIHDVLITILSRCQLTHFKSPTIEELDAFLLKNKIENQSLNKILASINDGDLSKIYELLHNRNPIDDFGELYSDFINFFKGINIKETTLKVHSHIDFLNSKGREFTKNFLNYLLNKMENEFLSNDNSILSVDNMTVLRDIIEHYLMLIERNISIKMAVTSMLVSCRKANINANFTLLIQENILT